ncbi:patatin-like phospholipase family protein [Cellvibrio polysaccharolyticus]|uniref:Patatin-like phospholipase family protein n=1 Tax=Cellvibrio polysaccharolyticus TaxID=2082724 RepID=A0A928V512_9GAMM|nr:patatin-like phospholipase family protein [Cellvibrio polysaccharolyticus]MBE8716717.1 patatin-like phospholipase family protein [Cellvibrio polysaccharolyticus]
MKKRALVLSGGGARAAYQVGVLQALAELLPADINNPFPIICGTSAGAINAVALASHPGTFREAVTGLASLWKTLTPGHIFHDGWGDLSKGISLLAMSLLNEGVGGKKPLSLLDNAPLWQLLGDTIHLENIETAIKNNRLLAVSVSAMGYSSGKSISFFEGVPELQGWNRYRRAGVPTRLRLEHLIASSAIPTIFPSVRIDQDYYGDGALRQLAPISPALHLGAESVFVIGVSGNRSNRNWIKKKPARHSPSMGQIVGHLFNSAFIDAMEGDLEHMERLNELLDLIPPERREEAGLILRPVENRVISPSRSVDSVAGRCIRYLPGSLRFFMRAIGATAKSGGATAASYLLFVNEFISELMAMGYQDTMWEAEDLKDYFADIIESADAARQKK